MRMSTSLVRMVAVLCAGALALTACSLGGGQSGGDSADSSGAVESSDSLLPPAEGKTQYPLTLESPFGSQTLEQRPERIAVVDGYGVSPALLFSVNAQPVVLGSRYQQGAEYIEPAAIGNESLMTNTLFFDKENKFETLLQSAPDLIIALNQTALANEFERLSEIAPVLTMEEEATDYLHIDFNAAASRVGLALDVQDLMVKAVDDKMAEVAAAGARHPEWVGKTLRVVNPLEDRLVINTGNGGSVSIPFKLLGFTEARDLSGESAMNEYAVSYENVGLLNEDDVILGYEFDYASGQSSLDRIRNSPAFSTLSVAETGWITSIISPDDVDPSHTLSLASAIEYSDPISIVWAAEEVERILEPLNIR